MPVLHVPNSLRHLTGDRDRFEVPGRTLGQVFAALAVECPALVARIVEGDHLRADLAVAIDGSILEDIGLWHPVDEGTEIYLVPPIGGGAP